MRYYMVEGNIIYPDKQMLTWGAFYYHSREKAIERMDIILEDIVNWCNLQDSSLNIKAENLIRCSGNTQIAFDIKAWKNEKELCDCDGIITVEDVFFEDEKEYNDNSL